MPSLSTHVLDLYHGTPANSVKIDVYFQQKDGPWQLVKTVKTNSDGRCDEPLVTEDTCQPGTYELVFHIDAYFAAKSVTLPNPNFLTTVPVRFNMTNEPLHYHVPLLVSPWGYQVYRGS